MEILGKLLGGVSRVKIMRLFLLNPDQIYDIQDVSERSRVHRTAARKVLTGLIAMKLIQKKSFFKEFTTARGKIKKKRTQGWYLDASFPYIVELRQLLIEGEFFKHADVARRFRPAGKIQFLVISGVFLQQLEGRLDLLIVGDNLRKNFVQKTVQILESELGKELSYALFDTQDFKYRVSMYDKLLRDVFDYPHERLIASKDFTHFIFPR
ncbi:hypothetical protein IT401_01830 [Candidatus Nomurabacteria bacterium]|nr:hypothetical protein [Candidatus Nomurabacteria bacterium]